jgi:hypothetical protein
MLAPVTHILPLTTIVRHRALPISGRVTVRTGQKVNPTDVIAEATISRDHVLIDIGRTLKLSPDAADKYLKCRRGDKVEKNGLLALSGGLMSREITSPVAGLVVAAGGGKVLLETGEVPIEVRAGIPGVVADLIGDKGAVIQGTGALIQAVWGNGRLDLGLMLNLSEKHGDVLDASRLDVSMRGSVILAGHLENQDCLRVASELPVRGMILGSMSPALIQVASQMRYPIVIIEGFGYRPMNLAAYKLLTTNTKREVTVNAEPYDRFEGTRPEVVIPLPVQQEPGEPREFEAFAPGQVVRLCRNPNAGAIATLVALRPGLTQIASGLRVPVADVRIESGGVVTVPLVNLEVVG